MTEDNVIYRAFDALKEQFRSLADDYRKQVQHTAKLEEENRILRLSRRNQRGDDLCWLTGEEDTKALPEKEFLESCRRFRNQIAGVRGEATGCKTIAQLEARIGELEAWLIECLVAQCPQAQSPMVSSQAATYAGRILPEQLRAGNRLQVYKSNRIAELEANQK